MGHRSAERKGEETIRQGSVSGAVQPPEEGTYREEPGGAAEDLQQE